MNTRTKVGVFGGTFDPFHFGHLNSMVSVAERFGLDRIKAIPTFKSPLRIQTQGSTTEQRVEMLKRGISQQKAIEIDAQEVERGGISYTIDTLDSYLKEANPPHLFLIVGMDQFNKFDQWKDFARILTSVDLVVTSRPGTELPYSVDEWPPAIRALVDASDSQSAILKTGRTIFFVQLEDVEVSGTEIRRKIRLGQSVQNLVPPAVSEYIQQNKLYESVQRQIGDFAQFTTYCAKFLNEKGGINVQSYDLRDRQAPSEFTLICSGTSTRHASALAEHLIKEVKKDYNVWPETIEGQGEGRWIVVDYGALIVHTFYDFVRQEYRLEDLWNKSPK